MQRVRCIRRSFERLVPEYSSFTVTRTSRTSGMVLSWPLLHAVRVTRRGNPTIRFNNRDRAAAIRDVRVVVSVLIPIADCRTNRGIIENAYPLIGARRVIVRGYDHCAVA